MPEIEECLERLLEKIRRKETTISVPITECEGMILAEDIAAKMMVPPFPKSAMDGYAVRAADIAGASRENPVVLKVAGELLAGDYEEIPYVKKTAVRVMTGSFVPDGYDAVIRQEDTDYGETKVTVYREIAPFTNYCRTGEDIRAGETVIPANTRLTPLHLGLLASLGVDLVCVRQPAQIAILSTGTELTEVGSPLLPGKIYNSIAYILSADIRRQGLSVISMETCADEETLLTQKLLTALEKADFVITTGAVSVGKKDVMPAVLKSVGAEILFQRANIQPGTPTLASEIHGKMVLSLSGNPYAAIANFEVYFWAAMAKMMGNASYEPRRGKAVLRSEYKKVNRGRRLIRAFCRNGEVTLPASVHASSVIQNLTACNCFIDLEAGRAVQPGDEVRILYFKNTI